MKFKVLLLFLGLLPFYAWSQVPIFYEDFGSTGNFMAPANTYSDYSTNKSYFSSDSIAIYNWGDASGANYDGSSGEGFALCGYRDNNVVNIIQIGPVNTSEYSNISLSFGAGTWWGYADAFMDIYYSTNGTYWSQLDDSQLSEGQYSDASWGFVELSESLPSTSQLYIKFHVTNTAQSVRFDDITISGFSSDTNPPTQPSSLTLVEKDYNTILFDWSPSEDEDGIDHYDILVNGIYHQSSIETGASIKYLEPGTDYDISVVAYDAGNNASGESEVLSVSLDQLPSDYTYSWQKQQAKVISTGNLEWNPLDFEYEPGSSIRYIDYENGSDNNDGTSTATAWKHHPWDSQASGNAASCNGIHTYVFKKGVVYRGSLTAEESGEPGNPIRLTVDPSWGTGEAAIFGSTRYTGGWTLSSSSISPKIPDADKVWYRNISLSNPNMIAEIDGDEIKRIHPARTPNYQLVPEDPVEYWHVMNSKYYSSTDSKLWLGDPEVLIRDEEDYFDGGRIWSQEDAIVMCSVWSQDIIDYNSETGKISVSSENFGGANSRYYIENTPYLLDTTSEFYYDKSQGRLYLRLDGDKNPNTATIEIANKTQLINISSKEYIEISGLTFAFTTYNSVRFGNTDVKPTIKVYGYSNNIKISNNKFYYLNAGISVIGSGSSELNTEDIIVCDNDFHTIDDLALVFAVYSDVYLENIEILRNNIYNAGGRQRGRWYSSIPAIFAQLISGEVAGNIIELSWGNGLDVFWGKGGSSNMTVPFIRGLIHHNKASNTLMGTNDYGGIESWQGGPVFCYNNISHNASGYKHYNNSTIGEAFYFDGSFKHCVFNNIASGVSPERNNSAFMQVLGYYNQYVHNSGYNTSQMFASGSGDLRSCGCNTYLSNVGDGITNYIYNSIYTGYIPFDAYANNVSAGTEFTGSLVEKSSQYELDGFISLLEDYKSRKTETGWNAVADVFEDPANFDFRPRMDGEAIDRGVKFFSPFPLSSVVGEWNFYKHQADSTLIMAENFYMTSDFSSRTSYYSIPKNHLTAHNLSENSFQYGDLEDWMPGALYFDGENTYCSLSYIESFTYVSNNVDMIRNSFILETYFQSDIGHTNGTLISKTDGNNGYEMGIDESGLVKVSLNYGGNEVSATSDSPVNDGEWHHLLAEVNRYGSIRIFVDGVLSSVPLSGSFPDTETSLTNTNDLLIGKSTDGNYFKGMIDFLRISKGTLQDARTTIGEIYTWLTDGPYLYDFTGSAPIGTRDAGAIEAGLKNCSLSVSSLSLEFDADASTQDISITADEGFSIYDTEGDFFSTELDGNTLSVSVSENTLFEENNGKIEIFACNESATISIYQSGADCLLEPETDNIETDWEAKTLKVKVNTNSELTAKRSATFFKVNVVETGDSIEITINENTMGTERSGYVTLFACDEEVILPIVQGGNPNSVGNYFDENVEIYPNPVSKGEFTINLISQLSECTASISDLDGKVVFNKELNQYINIIEPSLSAGIYLLRITGPDMDIVQKLVIL